MKECERTFLAQVALGYFVMDDAGRIWRHYRSVGGSQQGSPSYMEPVRPRRAERSASRSYRKIMFATEAGKRMAVYAHRIVWMLANHATIPDALEMNHKDGNPQNNDPANLELVTHRENALHAATVLGRMGKKEQRGEKNTSAKLTPMQVLEIRALCASKAMAQSKIGVLYGITQCTVSEIHCRNTWKHLP